MPAATFYVNELNNPPLPVDIVSPRHGDLLPTAAALLVWYPTRDPDAGDTIRQYQLQVARNRHSPRRSLTRRKSRSAEDPRTDRGPSPWRWINSTALAS